MEHIYFLDFCIFINYYHVHKILLNKTTGEERVWQLLNKSNTDWDRQRKN